MELAEDYTELIADLIEEHGEARTCEIAKSMQVSHVSAVRAIQRLRRDGFVETDPHKPVVLTDKGKELANLSKERHALLLKFLLAIGVPKEIAEIDAEGMEHHVSNATLDAMNQYLRKSSRRGV
jgi:DtxR family manganese transport transcriptional regulator